MDSALRPRDIQARIRAGETPEAVAQAAQTSVDKIMMYAAPVLAERRARRRARPALVRTPRAAATPASAAPSARPSAPTCAPQRRPRHRRLGRLAPRGRPLVADRAVRRRSRPARGHRRVHLRRPRQLRRRSTTTTPAGWSARSSPARPQPQPRRPPGAPPPAVAVPGDDPVTDRDELPLGVDAIELVTPSQPVEAFLDDTPASDDPELREEAAEAAAAERCRADADDAEADDAGDEPPAPRRCRRSAAGPRCRAGTRSCSAAATSSAQRCRRDRCPSMPVTSKYAPTMSYFVTGATGFIGRHLVQELVDHREGDIFVLVREGSRPGWRP